MRQDSSQCLPNSQPIESLALNARIRAELEGRFSWPPALMPVTEPLRCLSSIMDLRKLGSVAERVHQRRELSFTIVSKEYINTGLNWIHAIRKIGLSNFLVVAGDVFTARILDEHNVPNIVAEIDESGFDPSFVSVTGFSAKGLAVNTLKFPVARFLLTSGYSVVLSDADAVWLRDPMPCLRDAAVTFQRIVYHPQEIAKLWGFAACGGFLSFRSGERTVSFLDQCLDEHRRVLSDQVAVNLALLEGWPDWHCELGGRILPRDNVSQDRSMLESRFLESAKYAIRGRLQKTGLEVLALPHDKFWRHEFVSSALSAMIVCHPNSPKADAEKMKVFNSMRLGCCGDGSSRR